MASFSWIRQDLLPIPYVPQPKELSDTGFVSCFAQTGNLECLVFFGS